MKWTEYVQLPAPMFDVGIIGYLNSSGAEGLFFRVPAVGPEVPYGPFITVMRGMWDRLAALDAVETP